MLWTSVEFGSDHLQSPGISRFCVVLVMGWKRAQVICRKACNSKGLILSPLCCPFFRAERCFGVTIPNVRCSFDHPVSAGGICSKARSPGPVSQAVWTHQDRARGSDGWEMCRNCFCFFPDLLWAGLLLPTADAGVSVGWVWLKPGDGGVVSGGTEALREAQVGCHP